MTDLIEHLGDSFTKSLQEEAEKLQTKADRVVKLVYIMTGANLLTLALSIVLLVKSI